MAVLQQVPGLSVNVKVAGQVATEYNDPHEHEVENDQYPVSRCYIESKSAAQFGIETTIEYRYLFPLGLDTLLMYVYIDGAYVGGSANPSIRTLPKPYTMFFEGQYTPSSTPNKVFLEKLVFSPVVSVDNSEKSRIIRDTQVAKSLGVIQVQIKAARQLGQGALHCPPPRNNKHKFELAEKSMKGRELSHGTITSSKKEIAQPRTVSTEAEVVVGNFYFKYRSRESLQREMVLPRTPTPPAPNGIEDLSKEQIRQLAMERLRDMKKAEDPPRRIKREAGSPPVLARPLKVIKLPDGKDAYDLTDE